MRPGAGSRAAGRSPRKNARGAGSGSLHQVFGARVVPSASRPMALAQWVWVSRARARRFISATKARLDLPTRCARVAAASLACEQQPAQEVGHRHLLAAVSR